MFAHNSHHNLTQQQYVLLRCLQLCMTMSTAVYADCARCCNVFLTVPVTSAPCMCGCTQLCAECVYVSLTVLAKVSITFAPVIQQVGPRAAGAWSRASWVPTSSWRRTASSRPSPRRGRCRRGLCILCCVLCAACCVVRWCCVVI
jgi:hypothetical protein